MEIILLRSSCYGKEGDTITVDIEQGRKLCADGLAKPAPVNLAVDNSVQVMSCST